MKDSDVLQLDGRIRDAFPFAHSSCADTQLITSPRSTFQDRQPQFQPQPYVHVSPSSCPVMYPSYPIALLNTAGCANNFTKNYQSFSAMCRPLNHYVSSNWISLILIPNLIRGQPSMLLTMAKVCFKW